MFQADDLQFFVTPGNATRARDGKGKFPKMLPMPDITPTGEHDCVRICDRGDGVDVDKRMLDGRKAATTAALISYKRGRDGKGKGVNLG